MTTSYTRPRIVVVTRKTPLEVLLDRHGTYEQAKFYLASRGQTTAWYDEAHERFRAGLARVMELIPTDQRRVRVDRDQLDRFLFAPDDILLIVGQDGLVPNAAKYLHGQLTIGINPDPERYDGVLCPHPPGSLPDILSWLEAGQPHTRYRVQARTMAIAERKDGQTLLSLNEVFVGHKSHQSAKYRIEVGDRTERHSSSGIIIATGTGSTGWARSIAEQRGLAMNLPGPEAQVLVWFVREPFPSVATGTTLDYGLIFGTDTRLVVTSEMGQDGVIFADGIEQDRLDFVDGHTVRVGIAKEALNLVVPLG